MDKLYLVFIASKLSLDDKEFNELFTFTKENIPESVINYYYAYLPSIIMHIDSKKDYEKRYENISFILKKIVRLIENGNNELALFIVNKGLKILDKKIEKYNLESKNTKKFR